MWPDDLGSPFRDDSRGVSELIGALLIFSMLVVLLSVYQAQVVPQENREIEFQHFQDVQDDMVAIRAGISTAGQANVSRFPTITIGANYRERRVAVNPSDPAGRLRSSGPYPLYVNSSSRSETIDTRFLEYRNGYNELRVGSIWYEHGVLYLDERNRSNGIVVLGDQNFVRENSSVRVNALQNEFSESSGDRVAVELYPAERSDADIANMNGPLKLEIPTRLNATEYWDDELGSFDGYDGVNENGVQSGVHLLKLTVDADALKINTVGIDSAPEDNGSARHGVGPGSTGGTGDTQPEDEGLDNDGAIVYKGLNVTEGDGGNTSSLDASNVKALGPATADLTGNGTTDLPYVGTNGSLKIVDNDENTQTLENKSSSPEPGKTKTLMAVTEWQGSDTSVFYANEGQDTIYRVNDTGPSVEVATLAGNGARAVMGTGDIDGDGDDELIFAGDSQSVRYLESDGTTQKVSGGGAGLENGIGVGQPSDFDGDGTVRVVIIDGGNNVKLVGDTEPDKTFDTDSASNVATDAKKAPVTAADVDDDGDLEIVYVWSGGTVKYIDDPLGSPTTRFLKDDGGNKIDGDGELGVVS